MRNRLRKNLVVFFGATLLAKLVSLLIIGYPAKILGPENFGIVVTGLSITAYASIIIWPGIANWAAMEIARCPERTNEIVSGVIFSRTFLAFIAVLVVGLITYLTSLTSIEKYVIFASLLILFPLALNCDWVFYGKELPKLPAVILLFISIINVILIKSLIKSPSDLLIHAFIPPTTAMLFSIGLLASLGGINIKLSFPKYKTILLIFQESRYLGFAGAFIILLQYANNLIVRSNLDTQSAGIFGAAFFLFQVTMLVPATLNSIFMGRVARTIGANQEEVSSNICGIFKIYLVLGFTLCFSIYVGSPVIIEKLYGSSYFESIWLLKLMSFGIVCNFAITAIAGFLAALKKERAVLLAVIVSLLASVIGGGLLVSIYGLTGAAIAFIMIDAAGLAVAVYYLKLRIPNFSLANEKYIFFSMFFLYVVFEVSKYYLTNHTLEIQCLFITTAIIGGSYKSIALISRLDSDK